MQIRDDVERKSVFYGKSNGFTTLEASFYRVICTLLPVNYMQIRGMKACFLTEKWLNFGAQAAEWLVMSCVSVNCEKCSCLAICKQPCARLQISQAWEDVLSRKFTKINLHETMRIKVNLRWQSGLGILHQTAILCLGRFYKLPP